MVKLIMIEGSPEDVLAVAKGLESGSSVTATNAVEATESSADVEDEAEYTDKERVFVTVEVARHVINRRPLSKEQKLVFKTLADAHPNWVQALELQQATEYSRASFAGLMGAFGRRLTHTEGYVAGSWLFDQEWNYEKAAYQYRLPETVLAAVREEGIA